MGIPLPRFNLAAGNPRAGISRGIRFQIIFLLMNNYRFANDRILTTQAEFYFLIELHDSGSIRFNISEIADVMVGRVWSTVMMVGWIEMRASRRRIRRGAIAFVVNMKTVLA